MRVCFFFGEAEHALYGVHHPPSSANQQQAILLCYPYGHEYMRSHRAFVRLSNQLAEAGFHVLRFDYTATGDSAGDDGEGCMDDWLIDIRTAVQELRDISGIETVSMIGLRLGAALATTAATSLSNIDRLILWDPVISGTTYLEDLASLHAGYVQDSYHFPNPHKQSIDGLKTEELLGFKYPLKMRKSLSKLDISQLQEIDVRNIILILSEGQPEHIRLLQYLSKLGVQAEICSCPDNVAWENPLVTDLGLTPHKVIERIFQLLTEDNS